MHDALLVLSFSRMGVSLRHDGSDMSPNVVALYLLFKHTPSIYSLRLGWRPYSSISSFAKDGK